MNQESLLECQYSDPKNALTNFYYRNPMSSNFIYYSMSLIKYFRGKIGVFSPYTTRQWFFYFFSTNFRPHVQRHNNIGRAPNESKISIQSFFLLINPILDNLIICGIDHNSIWKDLLCFEGTEYKMRVLFSYPEKEETQHSLMDYIFPEPFRILKEKPEERELERYLNTNEYGETFYIHCKVIFEELAEKFLFNNYEIRNVPNKRRRNFSIVDEEFGRDSLHSRSDSRGKSWKNISNHKKNLDCEFVPNYTSPEFSCRIMKEVIALRRCANVLSVQLIFADVMNDWVIHYKIPSSSLFPSQVISFNIHFPGIYPIKSPKIRINMPWKAMKNKICLRSVGIFWHPELSVVDILSALSALFNDPNQIISRFPLLLRKHENKLENYSLDDMDMGQTRYTKIMRRATRRQKKKVPASSTNKTFYVPVGICLKTRNPYHESAAQLLQALITLLEKRKNIYHTNIQNSIASYAEFAFHVMTLTHLISPPPMTRYEIELGSIEYSEGEIGNFPLLNDLSVAKLFSLVDTEYIIALWVGMLQDTRIIVYTHSINDFFYIYSGLNQLMFPFHWEHLKGIIPHSSLLTQPPPYFYGLLNSVFCDKASIASLLKNEQIPHIFLDIESENYQDMKINCKGRFVPYSNDEQLLRDVQKIKREFFLPEGSAISSEIQQRFCLAIRRRFLEEASKLLKNFDLAIRKLSDDDFYQLSRNFLELFEEKDAKPSNPQERNFIKALSQSQCFALLYDEVYKEEQKNYARFQAIKKKQDLQNEEKLKVTISSDPNAVLELLEKLGRQNELKSQKENENNPIKQRIDWLSQIKKMQEHLKYPHAPVILLKNTSTLTKSGAESTESFDVDKLSQLNSKDNVDFIMQIKEESKFTSVDYPNVHIMSHLAPPNFVGNSADNSASNSVSNKEEKKETQIRHRGPIFYGQSGFLAFCEDLLSEHAGENSRISLIEEIKKILRRLRNSLSSSAQKN